MKRILIVIIFFIFIFISSVIFNNYHYFSCYEITEDGVLSLKEEYVNRSKKLELDKVIIPKKVRGIEVKKLADRIFYQEDIGDIQYGIDGVERIKKVIIKANLVSIGNQAFYGCENLEMIKFPDTITNVGMNVFTNTKWYDKQESDIYIGKILYEYKNILERKEFVIPDNVEYIADFAFHNSTLEKITFNDSLKKIGKYAFMNCLNLKEMKLSKNLETIEDSAFTGCTNLSDISFGDKITYISATAFLDTKWLANQGEGLIYINDICYKYIGNFKDEELVIKDGTTVIADEAFLGNDSLKKVILPDTIKSIGFKAFRGCSNLESINLPSSLEYIGDSVFELDTKLEVLEIPPKLRYIGHDSFYDCKEVDIKLFDNYVDKENYPFGISK